jgi:hypothetical protein
MNNVPTVFSQTQMALILAVAELPICLSGFW